MYITKKWRNIPGTNGKYQISLKTKEGLCRNTQTGKILRGGARDYNRIYWSLNVDGNICTFQAARWIAITFPEYLNTEYFEGAEIDHINGDAMDNRPKNLRWVTHKENLNNPLTRRAISRGIRNWQKINNKY